MIGLAIGSAIAGIAGTAISQAMANRKQDDVNQKNEALQREQWARDDTYNQRTVLDMQRAGLNPLNGISGTSSPLSAQMSAPQSMDFGSAIQNGFNGILQGIQADNQMKLQNNQLKLQALSLGINPDKLLDPSQYASIAQTFKKLYTNRALLAGAQAEDYNQGNQNPSNKYTSPIFKIINDLIPQEAQDTIKNPIHQGGKKIYNKVKKYVDEKKAQNNYKKVQKAMGKH